MKNFIYNYLLGLIIGINTIFLFCAVFIFPTNVPWVDDWQWIENLYTYDINYYLWLIKLENIHNHLTVKLLISFSKYFLNFNFQFFSYFSILLIFLSSLMVSNKLI